jgi:signal peptidase II
VPLFFIIAFVIYGLDVLTKVLVRSCMPVGMEIKLLPFFSLTHIENTGIAFGLFPNQNAVFIGIGLVMTAVLVWVAVKNFKETPFVTYVFALVLGGAWGNLTDRIFLGRVTDFLDFYWGAHHWPAFNVADSAICVGAFLLLLNNFHSLKGK